MRNAAKRLTYVLAAAAFLALPQAVFGGNHDCGRGPCPDCDITPGGTACFNKCTGEVCNYVSCECEVDPT